MDSMTLHTRTAGSKSIASRSRFNLMAQNNLDALVFPHQKCLVVPIGETNQPGINGVVAALAGFSSIVVPAGFFAPPDHAPVGVPVRVGIFGHPLGCREFPKVSSPLPPAP